MDSRPQVDQWTADDWRDLGFFYESIEDDKVWRLVGSRRGLLSFASMLRAYAVDPKYADIPSHEHYGPYCYLTVSTWSEPLITARGVCGMPKDLNRLADLVEKALLEAHVGDAVLLGTEYSDGEESDFSLRLELMRDGFDPASADHLL